MEEDVEYTSQPTPEPVPQQNMDPADSETSHDSVHDLSADSGLQMDQSLQHSFLRNVSDQRWVFTLHLLPYTNPRYH